MKRTHAASDRADLFVFILDAIALATLALTDEVQLGVLIGVAFLMILRIVAPFKMSSKVAVTAYALLIVGSGVTALLTHAHPVVAAASTAPLIHAFLWFTPALYQARGWRLSLGFVELILAATLTTSLFLPVAILIYGLLGSVGLSCHFLAKELDSQRSDISGFSLPDRYISRMLGVSCLIFLIAALIFPFLPRTQDQFNLGGDHTSVGYTEEVNISEWKSFSSSGPSSSALILYTDKELPPEFYINKGLIRSRTLDLFDGERWTPAPVTPPVETLIPKAKNPLKAVIFDVIREPLGVNTLPAPYGTYQVDPVQEESAAFIHANLLNNGDWSLSNSAHSRSHYKVRMSDISDPAYRELAQNDKPGVRHLAIPSHYQTGSLMSLSKKIFEGQKTDRQKISALSEYFKREKFQASTSGPSSELSADLKKKFTPLERFLFLEKQGHCELFSTATALLLRTANIPTRLVAGFRLTHASIQGMLMITPSDAHAWVEYWNPERGWTGLDPTPRVSMPSSSLRYFKDVYSLLDAYWSRYVLTYGESSTLISWLKDWKDSISIQKVRPFFEVLQDFFETEKEVLAAALTGILALGIALFFVLRTWFPAPFLARDRAGQGPWRLRNERTKMERWVKSHPGQSGEHIYSVWQTRYDQLRFGKGGAATRASVNELRQLREQLKSIATRDLRA